MYDEETTNGNCNITKTGIYDFDKLYLKKKKNETEKLQCIVISH